MRPLPSCPSVPNFNSARPLENWDSQAALVDFMIGQLSSRCAPADLVAELAPVLDDEAEPFVFKLWRALLFEVAKAQRLAAAGIAPKPAA